VRDNSGFSNWETERMFTYAEQKLSRIPYSTPELVAQLRSYEDKIARDGRKFFILYEPDPINYWEVYARLVQAAILHVKLKFLIPGYRDEVPRLQK
jgi:hypothetical protein